MYKINQEKTGKPYKDAERGKKVRKRRKIYLQETEKQVKFFPHRYNHVTGW